MSVILFIFVFLASGCTLVKGTGGAAIGLGQGAAAGAKEGFHDDVNFVNKADNWINGAGNWVSGAGGWVNKADNWIKDNLW